MFPGGRILRMDRDTVAGKDAYERILSAFGRGEADILIGTQMIAKGHDFPNVTLVGVLAADAVLNFSDYRATERTFQLLTQVAGRSGRGDAEGSVVIQTYNPDHFCVTAAKNHDYLKFYKQEMIARRALKYPPFMHIGVFTLTGADEARVCGAADKLYRSAREEASGGYVLLPPTRPPVAKIKERYRWRFIMKHEKTVALEEAARKTAREFYGRGGDRWVDLSFDVDPYSML